MTTTVNFVAAVGRVSAGAISALPKVEAICAKYSGRVTGGTGSSTDPIVAVFAEKLLAAQAAQEAFHLDDIEDARVVGADIGVIEGTKTEEEMDAITEGAVAEGGIDDDMSGHDAHIEVHVKQGGDHELVKDHIVKAMNAVGAAGYARDNLDHTSSDAHPIHDYQPADWTSKHTKGHVVVHVPSDSHFTDSDRPGDIHKVVHHLRNSPAAAHISAIRVTHDYIADDVGAMKKPDAPKSSAGEWSESIDAIVAGKTPAEVLDALLAAPAK